MIVNVFMIKISVFLNGEKELDLRFFIDESYYEYLEWFRYYVKCFVCICNFNFYDNFIR